MPASFSSNTSFYLLAGVNMPPEGVLIGVVPSWLPAANSPNRRAVGFFPPIIQKNRNGLPFAPFWDVLFLTTGRWAAYMQKIYKLKKFWTLSLRLKLCVWGIRIHI
jgi:hypothetical protein